MQPENFFPDPNIEAQQHAIQDLLASRADADEVLQENGFRREAIKLQLQTSAEFLDRAYTLARTAGLYAISEGHMSRVGLGRILGVHQSTVADWVKQAKENPEPERDYTKQPLRARNNHDKEPR